MSANFTAISATVLILSLAVGTYSEIAIRMLVNERLPQQERFYWWHQTYQTKKTYYQKYRELYPASRLPLIAKGAALLTPVGLILLSISRGSPLVQW